MTQMPLFQPATFTVSDLTGYIRELLESDEILQDLWVQGEISNFTHHSSGHLYFTLKDSSAELRCVMWRNMVQRQVSLPASGDAVEVHGTISVYEARGQYQFYADLIQPLGAGKLYQEFLRLKARLEAEGLFDPERKRPIPRWPGRIGVVTSPTGAAVRDILNTISRRFPLAEVIIAPTLVQGDGAPQKIVTALETLNETQHPDVILLARGGGSLEDLWAFNDERVARAIAASQAPVVTGVGHEVDFTIADFTADLRAPTPTAAAEVVTPDQAELRQILIEMTRRLGQVGLDRIQDQIWSLKELQNRLALRSPQAQLQNDRQRLDELVHRSQVALRHRVQLDHSGLTGIKQHLDSLNPMGVLGRGYAVVNRKDGTAVSSIDDIEVDDRLDVRLVDGTFESQVTDLGTNYEDRD
jgi:exodeoxyribonuclease VII large subunit